MANLYCGLITKFIYWQNDVIRNDVIFHDVTRCSMATIFLRGFDVLILIFIIFLWMIPRNQFYFCECKRRLCRISRICFNLCKNCHSNVTCTEHKLDRGGGGVISFFCYAYSRYVQNANEPIEEWEKSAYKDIPLRQYSSHDEIPPLS